MHHSHRRKPVTGMLMYVHVRRAPALALKTKALFSLAQESDRRDAMPRISFSTSSMCNTVPEWVR